MDIQDKMYLYSIASSESDIRICYLLNQILGINLSLAEDLIIHNKNSQQNFRNYYYERNHGSEKYYLILNRTHGIYLLPELKKIDYIFLTLADTAIGNMEVWIQEIKKRSEISAIIPIDPGKIKSFNKIKF